MGNEPTNDGHCRILSSVGRVVGRFGSRTKPDDKKLVAAIETETGK